jgi:RNA polymerase sigma factor (TIGR02999 family)
MLPPPVTDRRWAPPSGGFVADQVPLTEWLRAAGGGDRDAGQRAYAEIYAELRRLAGRQLGRAAPQATLTPTALVNEAFLRLARGHLESINDRRHFFNLAARAMRQTVIDYARERLAEKRGGDLIRTGLDDDMPDAHADAQQALALEQALGALEKQDGELAEAFIWRMFGGLSAGEIATLRGVTERTVHRDLDLARNYLRLALGGSA